jgi:glycosyltransferase involved in cell wall biosynthesis
MGYKIGFEAKRLFHNFRGLGNYGRTLVRGLAKYYPESEYQLYTPNFGDQRANLYRDEILKSPNVSIKTPKSYLGKILPALWRSKFISSDILSEDLDIFHGLSHELPSGLEKQTKTKKLVTIHDLIFLRYPEFFPFIDRVIYKRKFKYACTVADKVVAICEQTKNDLVEFLDVPAEKIVVHYQSCDPHFYEMFSDERKREVKRDHNLPERFVLFVGALEERKNVKTLIDAFALMKTKGVDLVVIGSGHEKENLQTRAETYKLTDRVHFLDKVSFADLPGIYQLAEVFCYPSFFEGFGIPIVEALFSGTPVVTSQGSCFPESGGDAARYINPYRSLELAEALDQILNSEDLKEEMIEKGLRYVQKFHVKETTRKLMEIYQSVIEQ